MSRRAFTLAEMLVALTAGSVMLGIGIGIVHLLMQTERNGRDRMHRSFVSTALAEQFRADAAAALRVISDKDKQPTQCRFAMDAHRTVIYSATTEAIQRVERTADKLVRQETYPLPANSSGVFRIDANAKPALATLVIAANPDHATLSREYCVTARLGKDHRFSQPAGEGK